MKQTNSILKLFYWSLRFGFVLIFSVFLGVAGLGTHIRAGEITVERVCGSNTFRFTILGYRDTGSPDNVQFGGGYFDFGDGSDPIQIPEGQFTTTYLGNEVERNVYVLEYTYSNIDTYVVSYLEPNRNDGILNIDNSVNTTFYIETKIVGDNLLGCNNSPQLLIPPIDEGCTQVAFYHNPGAYDPDGDSLSYEFTTPKQDRNVNVANYRDPNTSEFYLGDFSKGDETGTKRPTFTINGFTGEVKWDAPGAEGEYNIAIKIIEWRKIGNTLYQMGYVIRDMQIIIADCDNERPTLELPEDLCVEAGTLINETIIGKDMDGDDVKVEAYSQIFDDVTNPAAINPSPGPNDYVSQPSTTQFTWQTDCSRIREQPYQVVFKITDKPDDGPQLVTFQTWNITVIGPAPDFTSVARSNRTAELTWSKYVCTPQRNDVKIQIWRRVDSFDYTPVECETGIRENSGYKMIQVLEGSAVNYTDVELNWGAKYCYRIVASFSSSNGESIVSREICIDPIIADAPVITHVSVTTTDLEDGSIRVSWRSPFQLDKTGFDLPLKYRVIRGEGTSDLVNSLTFNVGSDTTFLDNGLNTEEQTYNYRIRLFDNADTEILTSATASSVRLEPNPEFRRIELNWSADVPWSNNILGLTHEIYRDHVDPNNLNSLEFYDYVKVNERGFYYLDSGQINNIPLEDTVEYCYYVKTYGSYGNPLINSPQINFSQIICAQPNDTIPPCKPILRIDALKCRDLGDTSSEGDYFFDNVDCDFNVYENKLEWSIPANCGADIRKYELYFLPSLGSTDTLLIASTIDSAFLHQNLTSFKGCYFVRAVDRSGNKSEFSDMVCKDNCPRFVLPNICTPNGSGTNDKFYAFSNLVSFDLDQKDCPRFVESVDFKVYNRWGKMVYEYNSNEASKNGESLSVSEAILIGWDGKTNKREELAAGVYYYSANVAFDLLDESNNVKTIKGWIQLMK